MDCYLEVKAELNPFPWQVAFSHSVYHSNRQQTKAVSTKVDCTIFLLGTRQGVSVPIIPVGLISAALLNVWLFPRCAAVEGSSCKISCTLGNSDLGNKGSPVDHLLLFLVIKTLTVNFLILCIDSMTTSMIKKKKKQSLSGNSGLKP